jgi:hypothetical protein
LFLSVSFQEVAGDPARALATAGRATNRVHKNRPDFKVFDRRLAMLVMMNGTSQCKVPAVEECRGVSGCLYFVWREETERSFLKCAERETNLGRNLRLFRPAAAGA